MFGSKKELYLASFTRCEHHLYESFVAAARGKTGQEALKAMGEAYMSSRRLKTG